MARGRADVLKRVRALARQRRVRFTLKAARELAALGLDTTDACETLEGLLAVDFIKSLISDSTGEWMYVFKPHAAGVVIYLKVVLRDGCLVVSFHEDENENEEDEEGC